MEMINKNNLEKSIVDFYGVHPYNQIVKLPLIGATKFPEVTITKYLLEEFNEEKRNKKPSELIKIVSSLSGENFDDSRLGYGQIRESYEKYSKKTIMNFPIAGSWLALMGSMLYSFYNPFVGIPLAISSIYLSCKLLEIRTKEIIGDEKEFSEFEKLLETSREADKLYKEKK